MDKMSFQGLPRVLGSHLILFQTPTVVSENVYISPTLVAPLYNAKVLMKTLTLLFTPIFTELR